LKHNNFIGIPTTVWSKNMSYYWEHDTLFMSRHCSIPVLGSLRLDRRSDGQRAESWQFAALIFFMLSGGSFCSW